MVFIWASVILSAENGEKTEKEAEAEPEEKEEEAEEKKVKAKAKKAEEPQEEGFELWKELEVQRNKFMVVINFAIGLNTLENNLCLFITDHSFVLPCVLHRITCLGTSTIYACWLCLSHSLSISSCSSTRSVTNTRTFLELRRHLTFPRLLFYL